MIRTFYNGRKRRPTGLDLFSGAGGMSLGFLMAGGDPIGAVDFDKDSICTYRSLFPRAQHVFLGDIEQWRPDSSVFGVDVVLGGPPCQGFSLARGLRFVDDPRNRLYKDFVRAVEHYRPEWFVMENVEGITNIGGGAVLQQILEDFEGIGYLVDYQVVNMAAHGVPQLRKRAIFVGNRRQVKFEWPEPSRQKRNGQGVSDATLPPYWSVNDALGDLGLPLGNYFAHRANSQMRGPRNRDAYLDPAFTLRVRGDEFALCEEPATSAFIPGPVPPDGQLLHQTENELQEYFRHDPPSWIEQGRRAHEASEKVELRGTRKLTVREQARLQSFPDWVNFTGSRVSQARQIGNAVPPLFAYHLFSRVLAYFD